MGVQAHASTSFCVNNTYKDILKTATTVKHTVWFLFYVWNLKTVPVVYCTRGFHMLSFLTLGAATFKI